MADYGVLSALRQLISSAEDIIQCGMADKVHLALPPGTNYPIVLLELEEIWTSLKLGEDCGHARLKLRTSVMNNGATNRENLGIADAIRQAVDGKTIKVDEDMRATIKLSSSIIDLPLKNGPKTVQQFYEVLVRG